MKALGLISLTLFSLAACAAPEETFREACKRVAEVKIADPPKWDAYIAQLKLEHQRWYGEDARLVFGGTARYEALHQRFESGRELIKNELSEDEMHVRDRSTGKLIGIVKTVETLRPHFGYSETQNCMWKHPEFYQRWVDIS